MAIDARGLREQLEEITDRYGDDRVAEQIPRIAELSAIFPHSISLLQAAIPGRPETFQFNCYQHSFGLARDESVLRVMREHLYVFPGREFVQFLLKTRLEEIRAGEAQNGDHVIYAGPEIEHAGIVQRERIESKWGLGHLWLHGVYEVPLRYGEQVRYFRRLTQETCERAFLEYAAERLRDRCRCWIWSTRAVECLHSGCPWTPGEARATGLVWSWDTSAACLIATRIEHLRAFLLQAVRQEPAYFRWLSRGAPLGDDLSDWYSAVKSMPDLT